MLARIDGDWVRLNLLGVIVHFVFLYSIFDIYYTSPIVSHARPKLLRRTEAPLAKRLVFFSAGMPLNELYNRCSLAYLDGLRSRTFYENSAESSFLHGLIRDNRAAYGVSRSHVPTESRPGHVALFAGFYEDVSAIARGWKHNPVRFDSVFNRSRAAFLFGSPDIVSMLGDEVPQARVNAYSGTEERFFDEDAAGLDRWVFDKFEVWPKVLTSVMLLFSRLQKLLSDTNAPIDGEGTVFLLHLLGFVRGH